MPSFESESTRASKKFWKIFDKFYAEDIEVSQEEIGEPIRGKARVGSFL
jgi:hypothetical protein